MFKGKPNSAEIVVEDVAPHGVIRAVLKYDHEGSPCGVVVEHLTSDAMGKEKWDEVEWITDIPLIRLFANIKHTMVFKEKT